MKRAPRLELVIECSHGAGEGVLDGSVAPGRRAVAAAEEGHPPQHEEPYTATVFKLLRFSKHGNYL